MENKSYDPFNPSNGKDCKKKWGGGENNENIQVQAVSENNFPRCDRGLEINRQLIPELDIDCL